MIRLYHKGSLDNLGIPGKIVPQNGEAYTAPDS